MSKSEKTSELIISVSGLRGIVGESLTPDVAARYASAFVADLPNGPIVVGRDGRASGPRLANAVQQALTAAGRNVLDADVAATPTIGVLVRLHQAAGGIQISASHNPPEYNGMKLFHSQGRVLTATEGQRVLDRYQGDLTSLASQHTGHASTLSDTCNRHCSLVLANVHVDEIRRRKFRVVLDSTHGAGSLLGKRLLGELGCEVTLLGGTPDGHFEHVAEPSEEASAGVCEHVIANGADVGFLQDPDADRLAVIDESGRYIGEEYTLALCLDHVLRRHPGAVVTNCATSRMSEDLANRYQVPFIRSAVGEANVVQAMFEHNAVFGGEGNGGPIDPRVGYVRDSFVGMALILDALAARSTTVSQLVGELPRYAIYKTKVPLRRDQVSASLDALQQHFSEATADRLDGLRLDWPDRWLLFRASNTEPIVRAIAEAPTFNEAKHLCDAAAEVIGGV